MANKKPRLTLGAAHDEPIKIANRAVREARRAVADDDPDGVRQAAETGWLALSSLADVAAARLGRPEPGGYSARRGTFKALETATRITRGSFGVPYENAKNQLHGACFHGDECPADPVETLEYYRKIVTDGMDAVSKIPQKKRRG